MVDIRRALDASAILGEGPCWDAGSQCLWWVDIRGRTIHRFDPATGHDDAFPAPNEPGSLACGADGKLIVAMGDGFYYFDPQAQGFERIAQVADNPPRTRMNDGRTDRQGRFWAASMALDGSGYGAIGKLYRLDAHHDCRPMIEGVGISNGLAWSPDGRTMYHSDSTTPYIWAWTFDPATGEIAHRRVFADLSPIDAIADGATVDAEGCYWVALPFKAMLHRYDPGGVLMQAIHLPVGVPTACEFGGAGLDSLFVTSAALDHGTSGTSDRSWAGALLAIDVGVRGIASTPFAGRQIRMEVR